MKTIAEKLQKIICSKEAIRASIAEKGIVCDADVPLSQFAEKIGAISGSGGVSLAACLPNYEKISINGEVKFVTYEKVDLTPTEG